MNMNLSRNICGLCICAILSGCSRQQPSMPDEPSRSGMGTMVADDQQSLIALLVDRDHIPKAKLVMSVLQEAGIDSSVEGSIVYGISVKKADAQVAIEVLKTDERLKDIKIDFSPSEGR